MEKLAALPLLPLTPKQRGMLGEARVRASFKAQKEARGISQAADFQSSTRQSLYFSSNFIAMARRPHLSGLHRSPMRWRLRL